MLREQLLHRQGLLPGSEEWCKIAETYDDKALGAPPRDRRS